MPSDPLLIIGGGPAGLEAARGAADLGCKTILVERRAELGGTPISAHYAAPPPGLRGEMVAAIEHEALVDIRRGTSVTACTGRAGDFTVTLQRDRRDETVTA